MKNCGIFKVLSIDEYRESAAVLVKSGIQFRVAEFGLGYSCLLLLNERDDCIRVSVTDNKFLFTLQCAILR